MKFSKYLKNNYLIILLFIVIIAIIDLMLVSFKTNNQAIVNKTIYKFGLAKSLITMQKSHKD